MSRYSEINNGIMVTGAKVLVPSISFVSIIAAFGLYASSNKFDNLESKSVDFGKLISRTVKTELVKTETVDVEENGVRYIIDGENVTVVYSDGKTIELNIDELYKEEKVLKRSL